MPFNALVFWTMHLEIESFLSKRKCNCIVVVRSLHTLIMYVLEHKFWTFSDVFEYLMLFFLERLMIQFAPLIYTLMYNYYFLKVFRTQHRVKNIHTVHIIFG